MKAGAVVIREKGIPMIVVDTEAAVLLIVTAEEDVIQVGT
jgi:hypothetical protein